MNLSLPVRCVVDASVVVKLALNEDHSTKVAALFAHLAADAQAHFQAPDLLDLERGNIFWKHIRRSGLAGDEATRFLADILALRIDRSPAISVAADALELAKDRDISVSDASYVAVAQQSDLPLLTADTRLVTRMAGHAVQVVDIAVVVVP